MVLPSLRVDDAKYVARAILGENVDEDIVRRVAVLGGDNSAGVVEAARTLVAVGDLIHDEERFLWRISPRAGVRAIPLVELLKERLAGLEEEPLRMLEAVCITPAGTPRLLVATIAEQDGLLAEVRREATDQLRKEAWLEGGSQLKPTSEFLRRLVLQRIPPARHAELCRFVAAAMTESSFFEGGLVNATLGYYHAEGGNAEEAATALLRAGDAALHARLHDATRRLAATAVQVHPHSSIRAVATRLSQAAASAAEEEDATSGTSISKTAVKALIKGDIDSVERTIDAAIAEGRDLVAADRVRVMTHLARGDTEAAMKVYARVQKSNKDDHSRARSSLTYAWILLHNGNARSAVRAALDALSATRAVKDPRGEAAALHTMAACYRTLGREKEAEAISDVAPV